MGTKVISFYDNFTCLGSDCPHTCCRGWRISIDEGTVQRYMEEPGLEGKRLRCTMTCGQEKDVRKFFGRCANETREGLCRLQLKGRTDLMPEVCRVYPRRSIAVDEDMEVTFELSCPLTARLFLENVDNIRLVDYEGEPIIPVWIQDRFNEKYYEDILIVRQKIIEYINSGVDIPELITSLFEFYRVLHKKVMTHEEIRDIDVISTINNLEIKKDRFKWNFYSIATFDKMIMIDLDDGRMSYKNVLRHFSKRYNKIFGQMTAGEANMFFQEQCTKMVEQYPSLRKKYRAYLAYYTYQSLYSSYETVTFYKEYLHGMVYLMTLIMTDVVDYVDGKEMEDVDRQVNNILAMEKRLRHNVSVKKHISKRINEEFTKAMEGYLF